MREREQFDEAENVYATELPAVLATCKTHASDDEISAQLEALFIVEEERVATAAVVAELLLPELARELRATAARSPREIPASLENPDPSPAPSRPVERTAPTDIAGFIDQMFAQADRDAAIVPQLNRRAS